MAACLSDASPSSWRANPLGQHHPVLQVALVELHGAAEGADGALHQAHPLGALVAAMADGFVVQVAGLLGELGRRAALPSRVVGPAASGGVGGAAAAGSRVEPSSKQPPSSAATSMRPRPPIHVPKYSAGLQEPCPHLVRKQRPASGKPHQVAFDGEQALMLQLFQ